MKTKYLLLFFSISLLFSCNEDITLVGNGNKEDIENSYELSPEEAKEILLSFIGDEIKTKSNGDIILSVKKKHDYAVKTVSTKSGGTINENIPVYEFEVSDNENNGFALVVGDRRINTVLAYVPYGNLADTVHFKPLSMFVEDIPNYIKAGIEAVNSDALSTRSIGPPTNNPYDPNDSGNKDTLQAFVNGFNEYYYCYLPTRWDQDYPYNGHIPFFCPYDIEYYNGRAPVGCTTTAATQIMAYHRKPNTYDWDLLLSTPRIFPEDSEERKNEIARLMARFAEGIETTYGCPYNDEGSGGSIQNARLFLIDSLGYQCEYLDNASPNYKERIKESLKNNMPCLASSRTHAYVYDGYGSKNYNININIKLLDGSYLENINMLTSYYYHLNMGWSGLNNGWYLVYSNILCEKSKYNNIQFTVKSEASSTRYIVDIQ